MYVLKQFLLVIAILNIAYAGPAKSRSIKSNIERFTIIPFHHAIHQDSIKVVSFIEIPFSSLQFVKTKNGFRAGYHASIALKDKKGNDLGHEIWSDSIFVSNYSETKSPVKNRKHYTIHHVVVGEKYELVGEFQDIDTRKKGTQNKKLNFSEYKNTPTLTQPTFFLSLDGDWGYGEGIIPTRGYKVREMGDGILLQVSGYLSQGLASVSVYLSNGTTIDSLVAVDQIEAHEGYFLKELFLPTDLLQSLKNEFKVVLSQGRQKDEKLVYFSTYKSGVSNFVRDIDIAMRQMRYILTNEEKLALKKVDKKDMEQQFYSLWKKRDPTPLTEYNELMEEYYGRVWYVNEHFDAWQPGWETDRGMIYILFGPPDEVQRTNPVSTNTSSILQVWYYYNLNKQFVFRDQNGFGDFRLETPFIGTGL